MDTMALGNLGDRSRRLSTQLHALKTGGGSAEQIAEMEAEREEVKNSIISMWRSHEGHGNER